MASWASTFFFTVPPCLRYVQGWFWTCCYYFLILSPLPQSWDCKRVTPHSVICGAEAAIQGFVNDRPALSQLSCIPRYLCCSDAVFPISLHLSSPVLCLLKLSLSIVLCFSTDPRGYFSQLLKMFIMTFCMNVAFMCWVHVCRCTCTCVCMPEVGLAWDFITDGSFPPCVSVSQQYLSCCFT